MTRLRKPVLELTCGLALAAVLSEATAIHVHATDATAEAAASEAQVAVEQLKSVTDPTILKLSYEWHSAGHDPGESNDNGFGDIKLATGGAHRFSETLSAGGGVELRP